MSRLDDVLNKLNNKEISIDEAKKSVENFFFSDLGDVKIDNNRSSRCGFGEVIFCTGKTKEQIEKAAVQILKSGSNLLATKADEEVFRAITKVDERAQYSLSAQTVFVEQKKERNGNVVVVTAGASDMAVAEEAAITAQVNGSNVVRIYDVGVAGIHRLLFFKEELARAKAIVAVAGMEGALPSVVGGLVSCPVIAVPTSVGYGTSFGGISALLSMLNSCVPSVSVVNIDNGFGAGYIASMINKQSQFVQEKDNEKVNIK